MSERTKHLIATRAAALATPMVGQADPARARRSARVDSLTQRQRQTGGLAADHRAPFTAGRTR